MRLSSAVYINGVARVCGAWGLIRLFRSQSRVSVIRGRVVSREGNGLIGIRVSVATDPQFGFTLTRSDGWGDPGNHVALRKNFFLYFQVTCLWCNTNVSFGNAHNINCGRPGSVPALKDNITFGVILAMEGNVNFVIPRNIY
ncbi:hypothetical protein AVEN_220011-1 [Araneus ventricosus]|uniref:Teneurin TTR-like domain-containing protein n=1 Tax=Araneus ventricosus TaxID=182803 RepID=A0A4Y2CQ47_ARAVE|nr:hypothetical protein AVEN_220011-1 [Araneus ventricosus]